MHATIGPLWPPLYRCTTQKQNRFSVRSHQLYFTNRFWFGHNQTYTTRTGFRFSHMSKFEDPWGGVTPGKFPDGRRNLHFLRPQGHCCIIPYPTLYEIILLGDEPDNRADATCTGNAIRQNSEMRCVERVLQLAHLDLPSVVEQLRTRTGSRFGHTSFTSTNGFWFGTDFKSGPVLARLQPDLQNQNHFSVWSHELSFQAELCCVLFPYFTEYHTCWRNRSGCACRPPTAAPRKRSSDWCSAASPWTRTPPWYEGWKTSTTLVVVGA